MTENRTSDAAPAGRARRITFTVVAAIAAFLVAVLTLGSFGLIVGGERPDGVPLTPDDRLAYLVHVPWLALGWGAAFVALLWRAAHRPAAYQQALAMAVGLYLTGLLAREPDPIFYIGFGVVLLLLGVLHPARRSVWRAGPDGFSPVLLPIALLIAAPCTLYAVDMVGRAQQAGPDGPFFLGIATTAVAVPLVGLVAALRAPGWRLPLWVTGGTLFLLVGSGAAAEPVAPASPSTGWALAGVLAAVAFVGLGEWEAQRIAPGPRRRPADVPAAASTVPN
jgi:hypothetical protein